MQPAHQDWHSLLAGAPRLIPDTPTEAYQGGYNLVRHFQTLGWIFPDADILDVGCGTGKLAVHLAPLPVRYTGVDVHSGAVSHCQRMFHGVKNCRFLPLDTRNGLYRPRGTTRPERTIFPFSNASFDLVVALSLFTHMERLRACRRYIAEIWRVLRPGGVLFSTWFRSPPCTVSASPHRTVFMERDIRALLADFLWLWEEGGVSSDYHDQWMIAVKKPARD